MRIWPFQNIIFMEYRSNKHNVEAGGTQRTYKAFTVRGSNPFIVIPAGRSPEGPGRLPEKNGMSIPLAGHPYLPAAPSASLRAGVQKNNLCRPFVDP